MSRAAAAVGADGSSFEAHQDPEHARCDGPQSLQPPDLAAFASDVAAHAELAGKRLA